MVLKQNNLNNTSNFTILMKALDSSSQTMLIKHSKLRMKQECQLCQHRHFNNLLSCPNLLNFVGKHGKQLPASYCKSCLMLTQLNKNHLSACPYNTSWVICKDTQVNVVLCNQCELHKHIQSWIQNNFQPVHGFKNLRRYNKLFGKQYIHKLNQKCLVAETVQPKQTVISKKQTKNQETIHTPDVADNQTKWCTIL